MHRAVQTALLSLLLAALIAGPALGAMTGTATWNQSTAQTGSTVYYSFSLAGGGGAPLANVSITSPVGGQVWLNDTPPGIGSHVLGVDGTWVLGIYNASLLASSTCAVSSWEAITQMITGLAGSVIPAIVSLVGAIVPLIVILALIPFIVGFLHIIMERIRLS